MVKARKLRIDELNRLTIDEFKRSEKLDVIILLDNIRSLNNVGSIFRTSDAFRIKKIVLTGITATPPNNEIHKTALGAEDSVDWEYVNDPLAAMAHLQAGGYKLLALEQVEGSTRLDAFKPVKGDKYVLILGNEVRGVRQDIVTASDGCLEIPQYGTKHSLNVSITAGIVIWHFYMALNDPL